MFLKFLFKVKIYIMWQKVYPSMIFKECMVWKSEGTYLPVYNYVFECEMKECFFLSLLLLYIAPKLFRLSVWLFFNLKWVDTWPEVYVGLDPHTFILMLITFYSRLFVFLSVIYLVSAKMDQCIVCMETMNMPTRIPCGHVYCYMCIKGVKRTIGTCPLCRRDISADPLEEGVLEGEAGEGGRATYKWFYAGDGGWWQYDRRSQVAIERAFSRNEDAKVLIIVGDMYVYITV